jgi:integrase
MQIPQLGVRTKNSKAAVTYLLNIPEIFDVVYAWDQRVRSAFSPSALWYATLNNDGMQLTETTRAIVGRVSVIGDDLRLICQKAGMQYLSPHKLRHGHIVYARNLAHDMAQLKAISQNVMHSSVLITDQVYAALTDNQVQNVIANLGQPRSAGSREELVVQLIEMLKSQL